MIKRRLNLGNRIHTTQQIFDRPRHAARRPHVPAGPQTPLLGVGTATSDKSSAVQAAASKQAHASGSRASPWEPAAGHGEDNDCAHSRTHANAATPGRWGREDRYLPAT